MQIWFIGRTLASQAEETGSTPAICFDRTVVDCPFYMHRPTQRDLLLAQRVGRAANREDESSLLDCTGVRVEYSC